MTVILGLDQGARLTGYCVGDGASVPQAGAWRFDDLHSSNIGGLGVRYETALIGLHERTRFTHVIFEAPLVDRYRDKVLTLRRRFGIDMILEKFCAAEGIVCEESPFSHLKRELAGRANAEKAEMVDVAVRLGVALPRTSADGREDAADGLAAWLIGVRLYARQHQQAWDQLLYGPRRSALL